MTTTASTGHENAPATALVAASCAACGRPLCDALSVELGMGPVCRERLGLAGDAPGRGEANEIVHAVACRGAADPAELRALRALGFASLADRLAERAGIEAAVTITAEGGVLVVTAPYRAAALDAWRGIPGQRWDGDRKERRIPASSKGALWSVLREHYAGLTGVGPKGEFAVEAAS